MHGQKRSQLAIHRLTEKKSTKTPRCVFAPRPRVAPVLTGVAGLQPMEHNKAMASTLFEEEAQWMASAPFVSLVFLMDWFSESVFGGIPSLALNTLDVAV